MGTPRFRISATVLGTPEPRALARFYAELLGWEVVVDRSEWVVLRPAGGGHGLAFQLEEFHARPVWPAESGEQQMQLHLDLGVDDLAAGVDAAQRLGATQAAYQPQDDVRVMLDPDGHPFCLFQTD